MSVCLHIYTVHVRTAVTEGTFCRGEGGWGGVGGQVGFMSDDLSSSKVGKLSLCPLAAPAGGSQTKHSAAFSIFTNQADFSCQRKVSRLVGPQISPNVSSSDH